MILVNDRVHVRKKNAASTQTFFFLTYISLSNLGIKGKVLRRQATLSNGDTGSSRCDSHKALAHHARATFRLRGLLWSLQDKGAQEGEEI